MCISLLILAHAASLAAEVTPSTIHVTLFNEFASFTNSDHPDNRIGYRFHEHTPLIFGEVPQGNDSARTAEAQIAEFVSRPGITTFKRRVKEEGWIPQLWTFYLVPDSDGIKMLFVVETEDAGLPEYYGIQQCFRLSGATNEAWRHKYALAPAFSEYDQWAKAPEGTEKPSLTWVLRDGSMQPLPASAEALGFRTPYGQKIDERMAGDSSKVPTNVGAYNAKMLGIADGGLIFRTSPDRSWSCGLYWQRTTHLTDHHPADCLHPIVNIGGIPAHSKRAVQGKIYWLRGSGEELVRHWRQDFPNPE